MASKEKKKSGGFGLESRHLVGLFLLFCVIFGVVFTLGYLLGRSQYDGNLRAAVGLPLGTSAQAAPKPAPTKPPASPADTQSVQAQQKNPDWDFYHAAEPQSSRDQLQPTPKTQSALARPAASPKPLATSAKVVKQAKGSDATAPLIPRGSIMLQVAAVMRQDDALGLAQALQEKRFPAFVIPPAADKYYRVQVGPYPDNQSAANARHDLEANGFKTLTKR